MYTLSGLQDTKGPLIVVKLDRRVQGTSGGLGLCLEGQAVLVEHPAPLPWGPLHTQPPLLGCLQHSVQKIVTEVILEVPLEPPTVVNLHQLEGIDHGSAHSPNPERVIALVERGLPSRTRLPPQTSPLLK